jgi:hypothetical protein
MKIIEVLTTSILFLLPGAIAPAFALGQHEPEKQPEQKQQQAKLAQEPQRAAQQQQARPAQQRQGAQQANRAQSGGSGHGDIPEARFRSSFGRGHTFHVNRGEFAGGSGRFQYGGYWFNVVDPWPVGWLYTDTFMLIT